MLPKKADLFKLHIATLRTMEALDAEITEIIEEHFIRKWKHKLLVRLIHEKQVRNELVIIESCLYVTQNSPKEVYYIPKENFLEESQSQQSHYG